MFELPEFVTLAKQFNDTLQGKTIRSGSLGNKPHKFVWYNRTHEEFTELTRGKTVGDARFTFLERIEDRRPDIFQTEPDENRERDRLTDQCQIHIHGGWPTSFEG